jgi:hypothetical protein
MTCHQSIFIAGLTASILCTAAGSRGDTAEPSVTIAPAVARAPANLRVQVRLPPDERNRTLTIELDSPVYYRSSSRGLDGDKNASIIDMRFNGVPAAEYDIRMTIGRGRDSVRRQLSAVVVEP